MANHSWPKKPQVHAWAEKGWPPSELSRVWNKVSTGPNSPGAPRSPECVPWLCVCVRLRNFSSVDASVEEALVSSLTQHLSNSIPVGASPRVCTWWRICHLFGILCARTHRAQCVGTLADDRTTFRELVKWRLANNDSLPPPGSCFGSKRPKVHCTVTVL